MVKSSGWPHQNVSIYFTLPTANHHEDKTERTLKILIYQPIKKRLCGLVSFRAIFYCHLETLQYLNNKDTCLKSLNVDPTIKKYF